MGLKTEYLKFMFDKVLGFDIPPRKHYAMLELGNQRMKYGDETLWPFINTIKLFSKQPFTGKEFFTKLGYHHISIDLNGFDGSQRMNLATPIVAENLLFQFEVLTNFGTTEHVTDQYQCFRNIDNLVKDNGYMVHLVPARGRGTAHGRWHYTLAFFAMLSDLAGYEIVAGPGVHYFGKPGNLYITCGYKKKRGHNFMNRKDFPIGLIDKNE